MPTCVSCVQSFSMPRQRQAWLVFDAHAEFSPKIEHAYLRVVCAVFFYARAKTGMLGI